MIRLKMTSRQLGLPHRIKQRLRKTHKKPTEHRKSEKSVMASHIFLLPPGGYVFIGISQSVCLLAGLCKKLLNRLSQNSVERWQMGQGKNTLDSHGGNADHTM